MRKGRVQLQVCSSFLYVAGAAATTLVTLPCAADPSGPVVWYRASQECPPGTEFLSKLSGAASGARLAQAGDHMDFVVTLQAASGESLGRLERQTQGGTVAIRELRDASCQRVADALALSLTLALQPSGQPPPEPAAASPAPGGGVQTSEPSVTAGRDSSDPRRGEDPPAPLITKAGATPGSKDVATPSRPAESHSWWLGAHGGVMTGLAPQPLARVAALVDREGAFPSFAPRLAFRLAVIGVVGSTATEIGSIPRWLLGGRLEGCPWSWGGASSLRPCVVFELGATGARGGRATGSEDVGLWAAPGAALRGGLAVAGRLRIEVEAGALFPLVRHDVYAGQVALQRADFASLQAGLGLSLGVP